MIDEIIMAIERGYDGNEDDIAAALIWLKENLSPSSATLSCVQELEDMDRCTRCGGKLEYNTKYTYHNEVDACRYESYDEAYCPECGGY